MTDLKEKDVRALFKTMHQDGTSTSNLVKTGRGNSAKPFESDGFLEKFDEMLEPGLEITKDAYKKFGV